MNNDTYSAKIEDLTKEQLGHIINVSNKVIIDKLLVIEKLEAKIQKLKSLILLTHPSVSNEVMNDLAIKQWNAFVGQFPEENNK